MQYVMEVHCAGFKGACYLVAADTSAAAPLAKPSTESLSSVMVVEVWSGSVMALGLELWGIQAAVTCCTCQQQNTLPLSI